MRKHTIEQLRQLQSLPLDAKIQLTLQRVDEWIAEFGEDGVYISFSGGKDSTVLLDVIRKKYPNIPAVFVDTGLEFPEIKQFVKQFSNVEVIRPSISFRQVIENYGYPLFSKSIAHGIDVARRNPNGVTRATRFNPDIKSQFNISKYSYLLEDDAPRINDKCCDIIKKKPAHEYQKRTGKKAILAQMTDESKLRQTKWLTFGCNAFESRNQISNPMSFWTEQDVLKYILENNLRICSVYGDVVVGDDGKLVTTGYKRTGCIYCAFGIHLEKNPNRIQQLKVTHPILYDYCIKPFENGGLGLGKVLDYCGIPYIYKEDMNEQGEKYE